MNMIFFRLFMSDYQRDTADLTLAEHGVYLLLLQHYYAFEGTIDTETARLYRLLRAETVGERRAVDLVVDRFFPVVDGRRTNRRADRELAEIAESHSRRAAAGSLGAQKRWQKPQVKAAPKKAPKSPKPAPDSWTARLIDVWRSRAGEPNAGALLRACKPLVEQYGEDAVSAALGRFLDAGQGKYGAPSFASTFREWQSPRRRSSDPRTDALHAEYEATTEETNVKF